MRFLAVALAVLSAVWAQDPEGLPVPTNSISSAVTPRTWASSATQRPPTLPTYSAPSVSWTTITSEGTLYQIAVRPKTTAWTTITSGGGVWKIPISTSSPTSAPEATAVPTPGAASAHSSHKTRTIVLSVIFSFLGAVLLLLASCLFYPAAMFFMRVRNQRRMRDRRSWAMRPGGWVSEQKNVDPLDPEIKDHTPFAEPQIPAPVPSHTRQRSL